MSCMVDEVGPLGVDVDQAGEELVAFLALDQEPQGRAAVGDLVLLVAAGRGGRSRSRRGAGRGSVSPAFCSTSISGSRGTKPTSWSGSSCSLAQSQLLVEPAKSLKVTHGLMMSRTASPLVLQAPP